MALPRRYNDKMFNKYKHILVINVSVFEEITVDPFLIYPTITH